MLSHWLDTWLEIALRWIPEVPDDFRGPLPIQARDGSTYYIIVA